MNKIIIAASLIFLVKNTINQKLPDAIRCGADNSCCDGAIFIIHTAQFTVGQNKILVMTKSLALKIAR